MHVGAHPAIWGPIAQNEHRGWGPRGWISRKEGNGIIAASKFIVGVIQAIRYESVVVKHPCGKKGALGVSQPLGGAVQAIVTRQGRGRISRAIE